MKYLLYPILFLYLLHASEVDKRFFSLETKKTFIEEVNQTIHQNTNKETALLERALLSKIEEVDRKTPTISLETIVFQKNTSVDIALLSKIIDHLIIAKKEQKETSTKIDQIESKLSFIKSKITNIILENKDQLLSYQLQFTLYQVMLNKEKSKLEMYDTYISEHSTRIENELLKIDTKSLNDMTNDIQKLEVNIDELKKKKLALTTKIEQELLLESPELENLKLEKAKLTDDLHLHYSKIIKDLLNASLIEIRQNKQDAYFFLLKRALNYIEEIDLDKTSDQYYYYQEVKHLGKKHFGAASIVHAASKEGLTDSLKYVNNILFKPLFVFNEKAISSADILKLLAIFIMGFFVAALYRRRVLNWSEKWVNTTPMTARLTANLGYYFIGFITILIALSSIGLDLSSFSMFASALAIGVGFGLQTVVSNMVAGIIMMFERSIRIGDFIEISDVLRGTVTDMRIRSTVVKTFDNIDIVVPNSSFIQNNVINLTLDDTTRRLHIPFGVAYGTEVETVQEAILGALKESDLNYYKGHDENKVPLVRMTAMGNSSVDYELLVWVEWGNKHKPAALTSDFLILIYKTLYKHHIEIPFPQLDLHVKNQKEENIQG